MPLRIEVEGVPGELAEAPEEAVQRLADIAAADGADREDWLTKAITGAGASGRHVAVLRDPRFRVVAHFRDRAAQIYETAMTLARNAVIERLEQDRRRQK